MATQEYIRRLANIIHQAEQDGIDANEYVKRTMQKAISNANPLINPIDPFVVLGIDGFNGSIFPCLSLQTVKEAKAIVETKTREEHLYSDADSVSTTFHVFTREGIHVPLDEGS